MSEAITTSFRRIEKKYLMTYAQYHSVLAGIQPYMRPDRYSRYSISNIYFDTDDYRLIRASLEKPVYKEKLRLRSYGTPTDTDNVFVELKKKFDGVVYKRRILLPAEQVTESCLPSRLAEQDTQISREIRWFLSFYRPTPKVFIGYDREAYAGIQQPDLRLTFDTGLRWRNTRLDLREGQDGIPLLPMELVLMEVKFPGSSPLWLSRLLSEAGVFPTSFSKYGTYFKTQRPILFSQNTRFQEVPIHA